MKGEATVLVIVPSPEMVLKIQQILDQAGGYLTIPVDSILEALEYTKKSSIDVCILDSLHTDFQIPELMSELRTVSPQMHLILIIAEHGLTRTQISNIKPNEFLPRSFSSAQLFAALKPASPKIYSPGPSPSQQVIPDPDQPNKLASPYMQVSNQKSYSGLDDFPNLNQRLSSLSDKTDALEILVLRRKQLYSYSGMLPQDAIQELVGLINSFSNISSQNLQKQISLSQQRVGNGDIVRFIQLALTNTRYLLYVVSLSREMMLALVFDPETQFSVVRRQTVQLARDLLTPQESSSLEYRTSQINTGELPIKQPAEAVQPISTIESSINQPVPARSELLPVQDATFAGSSSFPVNNPDDLQQQATRTKPKTAEKSSDSNIETTTGNPAPTIEAEITDYHDSAELHSQAAGKTPGDELDEIRSNIEIESENTPITLPFEQYITYSCLLVPRMPQHLVNSNLASYIFKWMGQLCLAYGWRLEHLSIHSDHIQWIAGAPLTTSPAFLVRTLRQKTSRYIFTQFPSLADENPSEDFWAPGFFISGGKQTIQPHFVDRYIHEIREHQGVYNSTLYQ
jgi:REP element-mobilizing transposase RayT